MTQAEKIAEKWAKEVLTTRWVDGEPFLSYIHQIAERTLEEILGKSKTIMVRGLQTEIVFAHDIRSCRWWEEEVKLPGFKDIIGLFKDGEDEEARRRDVRAKREEEKGK